MGVRVRLNLQTRCVSFGEMMVTHNFSRNDQVITINIQFIFMAECSDSGRMVFLDLSNSSHQVLSFAEFTIK